MAKSCGATQPGADRFSYPLLLTVGAAILSALVPVWVQAQQPLPKTGSCPSGYHQSGNYCTPSSARARPALPKVGNCPSGYHQSGDYCLASSDNAKPAVPKQGSCPSGYHQSGDYCLKS